MSWSFLIYILPFLRKKLLDIPNHRSSHLQPTPRGGGIVFVLITFIVILFSLVFSFGLNSIDYSFYFVILFSAPLAFVGFVDDNSSLPAFFRYLMQLLTAASLLLISPLFSPSFSYPLIYIFLLVTITAVINFVNFMDGLDGLVASCMSVAIAGILIKVSAPLPLWILVGTLFGFLILNWSPAIVFMGDVGSTFLGAVFAGLVLHAHTFLDALSMIFVVTPLLGDAAVCVFRRWVVGQHIFQAHRLHLFQRLNQAGWPHARVSLTYMSATAVLAVAMLAGGFFLVSVIAPLVLLVGVWLDQRIAVPFSVASKN